MLKNVGRFVILKAPPFAWQKRSFQVLIRLSTAFFRERLDIWPPFLSDTCPSCTRMALYKRRINLLPQTQAVWSEPPCH